MSKEEIKNTLFEMLRQEGFLIFRNCEDGAKWCFVKDGYMIEVFEDEGEYYFFGKSKEPIKTEEGFYVFESIGIKGSEMLPIFKFLSAWEDEDSEV